jgi:hypothetical protein
MCDKYSAFELLCSPKSAVFLPCFNILTEDVVKWARLLWDCNTLWSEFVYIYTFNVCLGLLTLRFLYSPWSYCVSHKHECSNKTSVGLHVQRSSWIPTTIPCGIRHHTHKNDFVIHQQYNSFPSKITAEWLAFLLRIRKVLGLCLGPEIMWHILWFFSVIR